MKPEKDNLREEYPEELVRSGVRGKHASRFKEGTNLVLIDPDLHEVFPNSEAVNKALRAYLAQRKQAQS